MKVEPVGFPDVCGFKQMRLKSFARFGLCKLIDLDGDDFQSERRWVGQDPKLTFRHASEKHLERSFMGRTLLSFLLRSEFLHEFTVFKEICVLHHE